MINRRLFIMLALVMLVNLFTPFISIDNGRGSFAADDPYYEYGTDEKLDGESSYHFNEDSNLPEDQRREVLFGDIQPGKLMVQQYDVSDIGWLNGKNMLWNRNNMYSDYRLMEEYPIQTALNNGYYVGDNHYYTDYIFFINGTWNGNIEQGGMARTARRIWGYYTPKYDGTYTFKVTTDDGHYFNFYKDDIFYDPKYDHYSKTDDFDAKWDRFYLEGIRPIPEVNNIAIKRVALRDSRGNLMSTDDYYYMREADGTIYYVTDEGRIFEQYTYTYWNNTQQTRYRVIDIDVSLFTKVNGSVTGINKDHAIYGTNKILTNKDVEYKEMKVTGGVSSQKSISMNAGEVYPFYIEYFNWGGGGKFTFEQKIGNGSWTHIDTSRVYPAVKNIPRKPANSGLDFDVVKGVRIVHGYDNFNDTTLNTEEVWDFATGFSLDTSSYELTDGTLISEGVLKSNGELSLIKLKKNYQYYDSYELTLDLVNIDNQVSGDSNGGLGISHGVDKWIYNTRMDFDSATNNWDKVFDINKYGSVTPTDKEGETLKPEVIFDHENNADETWQNSSIKMKIYAERKNASGTYEVTTSLYDADAYDEENEQAGRLSQITHTIASDELDFNQFFISAISPGKVVSFDNFDFLAKRNLKFDTLTVDWIDHQYKLKWDLIPGATKYVVKHQTGIDSAGNPIIEDYPANAEDLVSIENGYLFIPDNKNGYLDRKYSVVAFLDDDGDGKYDYEMNSNKKYLGGYFVDLELEGAYDGDDFVAYWDDFNVSNKGEIQSYTFSLYYSDETGAITKKVVGAQNLTKAQTWNPRTNRYEYRFTNLDPTDEYYNKKIQLVVDAVYSDTDTIKYYSNDVLIKARVRLGIEHVNNHYVLGWKSETGFDPYDLYRSGTADSYVNKSMISSLGLPYDTRNAIATNDEIYVIYPDDDSSYTNKFYIVGGNSNSTVEYSNVVRSYGDVTVPTLEWLPSTTYQWGQFAGATEVKLYYGESADEITTEMFNDPSDVLGADQEINQFISEKTEYLDKYVQAKFKKDGIWYYSNIVRTMDFNDLSGAIKNRGKNDSDAEIYDFTLNWSDIKWPEDGVNPSTRVSYYEVFYMDDNNVEQIIKTGNGDGRLLDSTYTIQDIFDSNSQYLNKKIHVRATCPIVDKFGIEYDAVLTSNGVTPRKIKFDSLIGVLDDESKVFEIKWDEPELLTDDSTEIINVTNYNVLYGDNKYDINVKANDVPLEPTVFNKSWSNVTEGSTYYHKFFKVSAAVDGVSYYSNTAYSGEKPVLKIDRFGDDFKMYWDKVLQADAIRVYYRDPKEGSEFKLFETADLKGDAVTYTLMDMSNNPDFDNKYYKIAAVFDQYDGYDGFEISSNELLVNSAQALPVLDGAYDSENKVYNVFWKDLDWEESYKLYYETENTGDDVSDDTTFTLVDVSETFDSNNTDYTFGNLSTSSYNEKYIRVRAINGYFTAYSNAEFVEEPPFDGRREEPFDKDEASVQLSNNFKLVYDFKVFKEMKSPYFEIELNGSDHLVFGKTNAILERTYNGETKDLPVRLAYRLNESTGITTFLVYLNDEEKILPGDNAIEYKLLVSSSVEVNPAKKDQVYEALRVARSNAENWELPYYIESIDKNSDNGDLDLDQDMFIKYSAHWKIDDRDVERQTSREMFDIVIQMKNKEELPSSLE